MELIRLIQSTWSGAQAPQAQNGEHTSTRNPYTLHTAIQQLHYWWTEELCSVYLEVVKYREKTNPDTSSALFVLCMMTGLHLLHPVMPHVTELVWQGLRQITSTPTRQHDSDDAPPRMCLAMQPFPREDWFTFISSFNAELVDRKFRTISELLHSAAQANAWRALLRTNPDYKPTDANSQVTLQLVEPERSTDAEEVMCALTRLTIRDETDTHLPTWLYLSLGSNWSLCIDPKAYDLDWTKQELERRLGRQIKRRDQFIGQLKETTDSAALEPNRTATQKLRGFEQRIEDLKRQLQSLENCL
ncbi:hypothetical protein FGIG_11237 [Fasciola gigantica]|uniref:valine--tRNA ligase n=1 Tax=Fasciola gigantica TaxID=46835 RepID=A0A504Z4D8_FASGI|nr:hypothetical protein FGIG_11237 [Fasciola gigantica]